MREPAKVDQLALGGNLRKGCPVVLPNGDELAAVLECPSPRGGPKALSASEIRMGKEMVQVDLRFSGAVQSHKSFSSG